MMDSSYTSGFIAGQNSNNRNDGMGWGGDWFWGIILIALLFNNGNWGNGWGNGGNFGGGFIPNAVANSYTDSAIQRGFDNAAVVSKLDGIANGLCDGFYATQTGMLNGFNGVQRDMCTGLANVAAGLTENRFAAQQSACSIERAIDNSRFDTQTGFNALGSQLASCCCDIRSGLKDIQFQNATDTCAIQTSLANVGRDIIDNQNANYRGLMDFMVQSKIDALQTENQALRLSASQSAQNAAIGAMITASEANIIRRTGNDCPIPAYVVPNPNCCYGPYGNSYGYGYNNSSCGCNSGCGC